MKNKVAIWAPLRYANYGDDMQAIAFAKLIKGLGYKVKVFQLEKSLSEQYDIEVASTVDELCQDVNLCIIAGGALLTPFSLPKRLLSKAAIEYEKDFKDLLNATKKYSIKFCAISMGGDGKQRPPHLYYSKHRINFFQSECFLNGTVRLEGDIKQMKEKFGKDFIYYPDMLFRTPDYFEIDKLPPSKKYRVGINFKKGKYLDKHLLQDIYRYAKTHNDIEFHFVTTHMKKVGLNYQFVPSEENDNIKIDRYESPKQLLGIVASMDIFITSMLHLGLTGLTMGTPFLSYRGPGKTKALLKSIKGEWAIVKDSLSFKELKNSFFFKDKKELFSYYDIQELNKMITESNKHYEFCKKIVEKYA